MNDLNPDAFETHRAHLTGLAYRMLGAVSEAEDIVQDAYLRWVRADPNEIRDPRAFLSKVVTRLCLDHWKTARSRRERYVGTWLPEPVANPEGWNAREASERADDLAMALMMALERLSPLERAAYLLHDIFGLGYDRIAQTLDRAEPTCRQLTARARDHIRHARPRFPIPAEEGAKLTAAFFTAAWDGDADELERLLAEDVILHADGGGKKAAALVPIVGRDRVKRFFLGLAKKPNRSGYQRVEPAQLNGQPGLILIEDDGTPSAVTLDFAEGQVTAIYFLRNPEKMAHLVR